MDETLLDVLLSCLDFLNCLSSTESQSFLADFKLIQSELVLFDRLPVVVNELVDFFADRVGQDELTAQAVALIEFSSKASELPHDLNEVALSLSIFEIDLLFLLEFLLKLFVELLVLLKCVSELDLVLLDDATSDLLVDGLSLRRYILSDKAHRIGMLPQLTRRRWLFRAHAEAFSNGVALWKL